MLNYTADLTNLDNVLNKRTYKLADVKDQLVSVAFDVVRFRDGDQASKLWKVDADSSGEYIVSLYDEEELPKTAGWEVSLSKKASTLNVFYKGAQLASLSAAALGIPTEELVFIGRYLPAKLATNKALVASLLDELSPAAKKLALEKHPELNSETV